ncbi:unnamed protein product [Rhizoctonia solani]|uniref:Uncharacterized protein n=1 Tax=Rhizoctonia solani TaxID=456999 RepID=A0A8H3H9X6_9AGAM|nr:unnamed protein product [Rhizoctonia solani]
MSRCGPSGLEKSRLANRHKTHTKIFAHGWRAMFPPRLPKRFASFMEVV